MNRIDPDAFKPIALPPGWDAQQDCNYFVERWDPDPSYAAALWRMMRFHHGHFLAALDASLDYFQRKDATLVYVEPLCLSAAEKIETLQEFARTSSLVGHCRERLLEDLQACEFTESERRRVLKEYRLGRDEAWMYPVIELIDYLGDAGVFLRETMNCENADFRRLTSERLEEPDDDF